MRPWHLLLKVQLFQHALSMPMMREWSSSNSSFIIQWGPCPEGSPTGLQCGQLSVPLDWDAPAVEQITLDIGRLQATNASQRLGSLIVNPGGPGELATQLCQYQAAGIPVFSEALTQHFDIICPDPRGVGASSAIACDPEIWNRNISMFPQSEQELQALVDWNRAKGESCLNISGDLVRHIDTTSAAKDLEAIRLALDDEKLNWLGLSYGTQLGAAYAELFPDNIRSMVLDSNVDHSLPSSTLIYTESSTYDAELGRFFDWCVASATACGLQLPDLRKAFADLILEADSSPIPAPACSLNSGAEAAGTCAETVTGQDVLVNVQGHLSYKSDVFGVLPGWEYLGSALNQAIADQNATLLSNSLALTNTSNMFVSTAIACLDWTTPNASNITEALGDFKQLYSQGYALNQFVGTASEMYTTVANCIGWPVEIVNPPHILNQQAMRRTPPILLVNADHDPSTSYAMALSLKAQIPNSALLTREGDGHISYILHGEAAALIDAYLISGVLPLDGTVVKS